MGKTDSAAKECLSDNVRFADLCNAVLFGGEQVVKADQLTEKDSTEVLSVLGADPKQIYLQKWRDILKNAVVKTDNYGYQVKEAAGEYAFMVLYFTGTGNSLYVAKKLDDVRLSISQIIFILC